MSAEPRRPSLCEECAGILAVVHKVLDEDLARVSPLAHAHVIPNGSYFQSPRRRAEGAPQPVLA